MLIRTREDVPEDVPYRDVYYVTFGVQYRTEKHPQGMHPDGYVLIIAGDIEDAREAAHELFGEKWAFLYDYLDEKSGRFKPSLHPDGALAVFDVRRTFPGV